MADTPDLPRLRSELEAERDRIREQIHGLTENATFDEGFADTSQVTAERSEIEALQGTLSDTLLEVEDAIAKFDAGTYGVCESCSQLILPARLDAMPMARLCIDCANAATKH